MKEIKNLMSKLIYYVGRFNIEKMSVLPRLIHKLNVILIKIPASPFFFLHIYRQVDSKIYMKRQGTKIAKATLKKKN